MMISKVIRMTEAFKAYDEFFVKVRAVELEDDLKLTTERLQTLDATEEIMWHHRQIEDLMVRFIEETNYELEESTIIDIAKSWIDWHEHRAMETFAIKTWFYWRPSMPSNSATMGDLFFIEGVTKNNGTLGELIYELYLDYLIGQAQEAWIHNNENESEYDYPEYMDIEEQTLDIDSALNFIAQRYIDEYQSHQSSGGIDDYCDTFLEASIGDLFDHGFFKTLRGEKSNDETEPLLVESMLLNKDEEINKWMLLAFMNDVLEYQYGSTHGHSEFCSVLLKKPVVERIAKLNREAI